MKHRNNLLMMAASVALTSCGIERANSKTLTETIRPPSTQLSDVTAAYNFHRVQETLYRWFYFYETSKPNFADQFRILHDDVMIQGPVTIRSLEEYKASLEQPHFVFGQNAHAVRHIVFEKLEKDEAKIRVEIEYSGVGLDGNPMAAVLRYEITMVDLPTHQHEIAKIKHMTITPVGASNSAFQSTYDHNFHMAQVHARAARLLNNGR